VIRVASARDLGPQFVANPDHVVGMDGAFSIPLGDKTLWFFGDTLIGRRTPGQSLWYIDDQPVGPTDMSGRGSIERMINNSGMLVPPQDASHGLREFEFIRDSRGVKPLIPLEGGEHPDRDRIWCQHGCAIDGKIYLSFIKVRMKPTGACPFPVCFDIIGSGLAVGSQSDWRFRRIARNGDSILWRADQPHFATATLPAGEHLYLFGSVSRDDVQRCYLARTRVDKIETIDCYEYFPDSLFDRMPSELSVSFNAHLGQYLAVHSLDLTGRIVARVAPHPRGPWSEPDDLWAVTVRRDKPLPYPPLVYAGKEHPELSRENGRVIYLTYVEFEEYFPHLVEVTLD
jgi:hypothetical protein